MPVDHHFDAIKLNLPFYRIINPVYVNGVPQFDNLAFNEEDEEK